MISEGLVLMVIGMSVVFAFLLVMIAVMNLTAVMVERFIPVVPETGRNTDLEIAVAAAAAKHYRSR